MPQHARQHDSAATAAASRSRVQAGPHLKTGSCNTCHPMYGQHVGKQAGRALALSSCSVSSAMRPLEGSASRSASRASSLAGFWTVRAAGQRQKQRGRDGREGGRQRRQQLRWARAGAPSRSPVVPALLFRLQATSRRPAVAGRRAAALLPDQLLLRTLLLGRTMRPVLQQGTTALPAAACSC